MKKDIGVESDLKELNKLSNNVIIESPSTDDILEKVEIKSHISKILLSCLNNNRVVRVNSDSLKNLQTVGLVQVRSKIVRLDNDKLYVASAARERVYPLHVASSSTDNDKIAFVPTARASEFGKKVMGYK